MVQDTRKTKTSNDAISDEVCQRVARRQAEDRERFWRAVERIGERNADKDPDETLRFVTEVVEEVRRERHGREQRAKGGD